MKISPSQVKISSAALVITAWVVDNAVKRVLIAWLCGSNFFKKNFYKELCAMDIQGMLRSIKLPLVGPLSIKGSRNPYLRSISIVNLAV